jgi:hypothetical protein
MTAPFVNHCGRCGAPMRACACTGAMLLTMPPPVAPTQPAVTRVRKAGFYTVCDICGLAVEWCKGHTLPEMGAGDGDSSDLNKRAREAQKR